MQMTLLQLCSIAALINRLVICAASFCLQTFDAAETINVGRRGLLITGVSPFFTTSASAKSVFPRPTTAESSMTIPLVSTGSECLIYYRVDGSPFCAILDTGSPFLMVPGSCGENTKFKSGCFKNQGVPSGLATTYERFAGFEGPVEWRKAPVSFVNATGSLMGPALITFGVVSEPLLSGPGGVFFGLIRDTEDWIRPSFLSQTAVQSFSVDLANNDRKSLTLSTQPMISGDYLPLVNDLRRRYGDPVSHYTVKVVSLTVNGVMMGNERKTMYAIIDTGVTGMVVSRELLTERYTTARQNRERNLWGDVKVSFRTAHGDTVNVSAAKPITTSFDPELSWKRFQGHVVVLGLAFLDNRKLTIDLDHDKLWIEQP